MNVAPEIATLERQAEKIGETLRIVCNLRATCEHVAFSPLLAEQVGESFAAHAFNPVPVVLLEGILIRLVALWDKSTINDATDANSFPAAKELVSHANVRAALVKRHTDRIEGELASPALQHGDFSAALSAVVPSEVQKYYEGKLSSLVKEIDGVRGSDGVARLANRRTKHLAHALEITKAERRGVAVAQPNVQDLAELIDQSIRLHQELTSIVTGKWEDWSRWIAVCERNARYLWEGCKIVPLG